MHPSFACRRVTIVASVGYTAPAYAAALSGGTVGAGYAPEILATLSRFIAADAVFAARFRGGGLARAGNETAKLETVAKNTVIAVGVRPAFADHTGACELETKLAGGTVQCDVATNQAVTRIRRAAVAVVAF